MKLIAIDFDNTLTALSVSGVAMVRLLQSHEHRVVCVTSREITDENIEAVEGWMEAHGLSDLAVFFTARESKVEYMARLGMSVDIWIEDDPRRCALGW